MITAEAFYVLFVCDQTTVYHQLTPGEHRQRVLKDLCLNTGNHTQETKTYQLAALMLFKNSIQENEDVYFAKYRK